MHKSLLLLLLLLLLIPVLLPPRVLAQELTPETWRDPATRCTYLKLGDTLSLRYRRDGAADCPSVPNLISGSNTSGTELQALTRSIEALRRDVGAMRREIELIRRETQDRRP
jgi:hypothetical protein